MRVMATHGSTVLEGTSRPRWFGVAVALLAMVALAGGFLGHNLLSRMVADKVQGLGALGVGALGLLGAILLVALAKARLIIDNDGIELRQRGKATRIRWSEPHDIYYQAMTGSDAPAVENVSVRTADGRRIDVGKVAVPEKPNANVAKAIEQYSTAANWPRIQERLDAGEELAFGCVRMSRERIELGDLSHPMARPICFRIAQGQIEVGVEKAWQRSTVRVCEVANYPCLLRAIGQVAQARPPA
jgi:hypothetical protein